MAAESPLKRQKDEEETEHVGETKRPKQQPPPSYTHILSLLDEEEEELTQDLSPLITTLQQELSSSDHDHENPTTVSVEDYASSSSTTTTPLSSSTSLGCEEEEEEDGEGSIDKTIVMRHLLEASDDELGIPNREEQQKLDSVVNDNGLGEIGVELGGFDNGVDNDVDCFAHSFNYGLWEFEDVNANYYTMLQSELFM